MFHGGGVEAYQARDLELAKLGHSIMLMVPRVFRELPTATRAVRRSDEIEVVPVALYGFRRNPFFFYNPVTTARLIRKFRPDVIDIHEEPYSLAAASVVLARYLARTKSAYIFRSSQNEFKKYPFPFSAIQSTVLKFSSAAYVPSNQAKEVLVRKGYKPSISVIGNGVEVPVGIAKTESSGHILRVVYVGRLSDRKGVEELVRAVVEIDGPLELTLVGSGPMEDELRQIVENNREAKARVHFVGAVPHESVVDWMKRSDVICVPSRELPGWSEQFSRALVEGMANYCVPLVSTSGALEEVSGGITRPFVWGQTQDLVSRLRELLALESLDGLKSKANLQAQRYSWTKTSEQISDIYEEVAK
ncbi:glycosyltransferase family 4 protein [Arthrobacter crystallopoietes]|uniref:glycosyltransferase family 4 protein n=1 Tax=Crystallibacter crystallopoietes TaxID=37928 RepID=UPI0013051444|nr:glycosyltransferase family 4 protein [Arthrobacter crystallopoietes]